MEPIFEKLAPSEILVMYREENTLLCVMNKDGRLIVFRVRMEERNNETTT